MCFCVFFGFVSLLFESAFSWLIVGATGELGASIDSLEFVDLFWWVNRLRGVVGC